MIITVPATKPSFLISPTIQDAIATINLNVTLQKWCSTCNSILSGLRGADSYLTSLLQISKYVTLFHYLFCSSKKLPNTYEDSNPAPYKIQMSKNKSKSDKGMAVFKPYGNLSLKEILCLKD